MPAASTEDSTHLGIAVLLLLTWPAVFAPPPRQREPGTGRARFSSVRHDLGEGLGWMRQHPAIRDITVMAGVVAAMDAEDGGRGRGSREALIAGVR